MKRKAAIAALREIAEKVWPECAGSEWYLFGSVARGSATPSDIDLMILCVDDRQADTLRNLIDQDALALPIHLCLLTFEEAKEINAVEMQQAEKIYQSSLLDDGSQLGSEHF